MTGAIRCRFDDAGSGDGSSFELVGLDELFVAHRVLDVTRVLDQAETAARRGAVVCGFVTYDAAPAFDHALQVRGLDPAASGLPLAWFAAFSSSTPVRPLSPVRDGYDRDPHPSALGAPSTSTPVGPDAPGAAAWVRGLGPDEHRSACAAVSRAIARGDTYLTNLTTRLCRPWGEHERPIDLYRHVISHYGGGIHALIETDEWAVISASPELFFSMHGRRVAMQPMKGTSARGRWPADDLERARSLATSAKERAENVMVVDLVRNDLGRIARLGTVEVPRLCALERHPALWQLTSTVEAEVTEGTTLSEVFTALFPSASVTGAPKASTMELIAEVEGSARGLYCGAIGYLRPGPPAANTGSDGEALEARFSVAIRTAVVDHVARTVSYGTGGGITWDSDPAAEWEELELKAQSLWSVASRGLPGPTLLETLRFDPDDCRPGSRGLVNLDRHLDRIAATAHFLGRPCPTDLASQLMAATQDAPPMRVRLLVHQDGSSAVECLPLPSASDRPVHLCLDREPVDPSDVGLYCKSTDRRRYDERSARHPGAEDVVMVNLRGEITETTRANVAVHIEGQWCTPPIECGLLPGVERARLIETGTLVERVITIDELLGASEVATLNSLRGWQSAQLAPCRHQ